MPEVWLSVEQFAELREVTPQAVRKALRKAWRSKAPDLTVRQVRGRGGRSGQRYEVLLTSLPAWLQDRFRGLSEPPERAAMIPAEAAPKFIAAPNQVEEERRKFAVLRLIADTEPRTSERRRAIKEAMVLEAAGMTTVTMGARTVTSSRIVSDPPVAWRAEGGQLNAGDPTLELHQLVANSLAVRVQATAELAQDLPEFGSQLLNVMGRALAQEIDRVGLFGTGLNNQPKGIVNTSGINTVAAVGTPTNYYHPVLGMQKLLEANVPLEFAERNAIMSPRTWASYENLYATNGQPMLRPKALERTIFRPTTSVPDNLGTGTNESKIVMGDFRDLVLGVRMEASVEALRLQTFAEKLTLEFVGWTRVDFLVRRPSSFVVLEGLTVR